MWDVSEIVQYLHGRSGKKKLKKDTEKGVMKIDRLISNRVAF